MTTPIANAQVYGDFAGLESLKRSAHGNDPAAIREVARQFESLFARMLIKSMRDAIGPDPIFGSDQEQTYQGMFDDQLSLELTRGHGLGLADMLVRQLQRRGLIGAQGAGGGTASPGSTGSSGSSGSSGSAGSGVSAASGVSVGSAGTPSSAASTQSPSIGSTPAGRGPTLGPSRSAALGTDRQAPAKTPAVSRAERQGFIRDLWPQARQAAQQLGVAPESLVAQAALETDWGRSVPQDASGRSSNNLFGVKAAGGWDGPSVSAGTREFSGGSARATTGEFRAYGSRAQGFDDYVALLKSNPRYASALNTGSNVEAFASALQRGGYATDPEYARKVSAVASDVASDAAEPGMLAQQPAGAVQSPLAGASAEPLKVASAGPITAGAESLL